MADRTVIALAALLVFSASMASAMPQPQPPMPLRDGAGAGLSALPLGAEIGMRGDVPSISLVLGAGPETKFASLDAEAFLRALPDQSSDTNLQHLAIVLSALALSWLGPARRQAAYRWIVRK